MFQTGFCYLPLYCLHHHKNFIPLHFCILLENVYLVYEKLEHIDVQRSNFNLLVLEEILCSSGLKINIVYTKLKNYYLTGRRNKLQVC